MDVVISESKCLWSDRDIYVEIKDKEQLEALEKMAEGCEETYTPGPPYLPRVKLWGERIFIAQTTPPAI